MSTYHLSTMIRRKKSNITTLKDEFGDWTVDQTKIVGLITDFFSKLYSADVDPQQSPHVPATHTFPCPSTETINDLSLPFTEPEVWNAIKMIGPYKAPGPDGFPGVFFHRNWSVVGPQVTKTVLNMLNHEIFPQNIGDALMVLIPKVSTPEQPSQFRPISLLNVIFKAATKMIVQRLKPILPDLIAPTQASFVPGRQIIDNVVVVQEVLHSMAERRRRKWMILKIDLEKAYDRIRWSFLREMLGKAHLPQKLINIIMKCQMIREMEVMWNGSRSGRFKPTRGIRQGDPLSPYLFVFCMEYLSHLIQDEVNCGNWKPITVGGVKLSHLFFADDLILFAEASSDQALVIKRCLDKFCSDSGEKVNYNKSSILFARSVASSVKTEVSGNLAIPVGNGLRQLPGSPDNLW